MWKDWNVQLKSYKDFDSNIEEKVYLDKQESEIVSIIYFVKRLNYNETNGRNVVMKKVVQ